MVFQTFQVALPTSNTGGHPNQRVSLPLRFYRQIVSNSNSLCLVLNSTTTSKLQCFTATPSSLVKLCITARMEALLRQIQVQGFKMAPCLRIKLVEFLSIRESRASCRSMTSSSKSPISIIKMLHQAIKFHKDLLVAGRGEWSLLISHLLKLECLMAKTLQALVQQPRNLFILPNNSSISSILAKERPMLDKMEYLPSCPLRTVHRDLQVHLRLAKLTSST